MYERERHTEWGADATEIMFSLMEKSPEGFTLDNFFARARQYSMPPDVIRRLADERFAEFVAVGYLKRTSEYREGRPIYIKSDAE